MRRSAALERKSLKGRGDGVQGRHRTQGFAVNHELADGAAQRVGLADAGMHAGQQRPCQLRRLGVAHLRSDFQPSAVIWHNFLAQLLKSHARPLRPHDWLRWNNSPVA